MRTIRTAKKRHLILDAIAGGLSVTAAARQAGISRRAVYDWRAADAGFAEDFETAFERGSDRLADHALQRVFSSMDPAHDALLIYLMKQRDPQRFNRKMVDARIVGDPNNSVTVQHQAGVVDPGQVQPGVRLIILPGDGDRADRGDSEDPREAAD
jgi:hypothetical protein